MKNLKLANMVLTVVGLIPANLNPPMGSEVFHLEDIGRALAEVKRRKLLVVMGGPYRFPFSARYFRATVGKQNYPLMTVGQLGHGQASDAGHAIWWALVDHLEKSK